MFKLRHGVAPRGRSKVNKDTCSLLPSGGLESGQASVLAMLTPLYSNGLEDMPTAARHWQASSLC